MAVALHGHFRPSVNAAGEVVDTPDIDIWYAPNYENYYNLLRVIAALGQDIARFKEEKTPNPRKSYFELPLAGFTLDFLLAIKADIPFAAAEKRKETFLFEETAIQFIHVEDLIADKKATGREKDLGDINALRNLGE